MNLLRLRRFRSRRSTFRRRATFSRPRFRLLLFLLLPAAGLLFGARNELLLGLGELKRFALEVLSRAAGLVDLLVRRFAVLAGDDRELLADLAVAKDFHRLLHVRYEAGFLDLDRVDG